MSWVCYRDLTLSTAEASGSSYIYKAGKFWECSFTHANSQQCITEEQNVFHALIGTEQKSHLGQGEWERPSGMRTSTSTGVTEGRGCINWILSHNELPHTQQLQTYSLSSLSADSVSATINLQPQKISTHKAFTVICKYGQSGKVRHPVCTFPVAVEQGNALSSGFSTHTANKSPLVVCFVLCFCIF